MMTAMSKQASMRPYAYLTRYQHKLMHNLSTREIQSEGHVLNTLGIKRRLLILGTLQGLAPTVGLGNH